MKTEGQIFGPGRPAGGARVALEASAAGLRIAASDGMQTLRPWSGMQMRVGGWDGKQLQLEWQEEGATVSLTVGDAAAVKAIQAYAKGKAVAGAPTGDRRGRRLGLALIFLSVGLPLLLLFGLVAGHERLAEWAVTWVTPEQEMKFGEAAFTRYRMGLKLQDEGPAALMVRDIGTRLTRGSAYRYQFHVAEEKAVNAFALPGGIVVVHTGLIQLAQTPEELAGVLAHEVQHVELRHSLKGMAKSLGLSALLQLFLGDLGSVASLGGDLLQLKFSRDHEAEADREGLKALLQAQIRPQGMRDFFGRMAEQEKLNLGFLSTHPSSAARMAELDRQLQALPPAALQAPALAIDFAAIKAALGKP